jgi:ComF family protein
VALNVLFPRWCLGCGKEGSYICPSCLEKLPRLNTEVPSHLDLPLSIDAIYSPFRFEGTVRRAVHELKYRHLRDVSGALAALMNEYLVHKEIPGDLLVPVPLHPGRLRWRGYNHAALLAGHLSHFCGLPLVSGCLARKKAAAPQAESASLEERRKNVTDAFFCCNGKISGKNVILVDDVATSGATLNACAAALKEAGAAAVYGLTIAREI